MRLPIVTYEYGDPEHPERITRAISGPPYTAEDHALIGGLRAYERTRCPGGCGFAIDVAWHSDMDGWFDDVHEYVCHACTAREGTERKFVSTATSRDFTVQPLPPFEMGGTTTAPTPPAPPAGRRTDATLEGGEL